MNTYTPNPIDVSDVTLPEELERLANLLAKNVHDVWSVGRLQQGWTYGPQRDDEKKQNPCLVPYEDLSDGEKSYDLNTAMDTRVKKVEASVTTLTGEGDGSVKKALADAKAYADSLSANYDAKGDAAQALKDAKAYTDSKVLVWGEF